MEESPLKTRDDFQNWPCPLQTMWRLADSLRYGRPCDRDPDTVEEQWAWSSFSSMCVSPRKSTLGRLLRQNSRDGNLTFKGHFFGGGGGHPDLWQHIFLGLVVVGKNNLADNSAQQRCTGSRSYVQFYLVGVIFLCEERLRNKKYLQILPSLLKCSNKAAAEEEDKYWKFPFDRERKISFRSFFLCLCLSREEQKVLRMAFSIVSRKYNYYWFASYPYPHDIRACNHFRWRSDKIAAKGHPESRIPRGSPLPTSHPLFSPRPFSSPPFLHPSFIFHTRRVDTFFCAEFDCLLGD